MKDKIVVISHFNENLDWVKDLKYKHVVYSRNCHIDFDQHFVQQHKIPNRGREALAYCQYFYDFYDNLPQWSICVHAHRHAWHNQSPIDVIINNFNFKFIKKYKNLSKIMIPMNNHEWDYAKKSWNQLFKGTLIIPPNLIFKSCAQFVVHSQLIKSIEKSVYKKWCNWLCDTNMEDLFAARLFEFMWCYIFTKQWNEIAWEKAILFL